MISYEYLQSGDPIYIGGVGHVRSPYLKELRPTGIGYELYNSYVYLLKAGQKELAKLLKVDELNMDVFEAITSYDALSRLYQEALSFFMSETVLFSEADKLFCVVQPNELSEGGVDIVGAITEQNFDNVRGAMLEANYISLAQTDIVTKFSSGAAEAVWKKVQQFQHELQDTSKESGDSSMTLGNLISKLCAIHPSINYLNVYDLTVFQFYDTFFQCSYMRSVEFSEDIVANHGSDKFKFEDWLTPIRN